MESKKIKMYIKQLEIKNIRSIKHFKMSFDEPAGWHVLIGDNGAGKSSVIRSIALALVGPEEIKGITPNWNEWLKFDETSGNINVEIEKTKGIDKQTSQVNSGSNKSGTKLEFPVNLKLIKEVSDGFVQLVEKAKSEAITTVWSSNTGWFSAGYGPFRRFTGGSPEKEKVFENNRLTRLASHLSLFGEDVALTEATKWLMTLKYQYLEKLTSVDLLNDIKSFVNSEDFLPHQAKLTEVGSNGVTFTDGNGIPISVTQMSDGYRSILSLTFELLRQLIRVYGSEEVFKNVRKKIFTIDLPGVVLIDEVDAHLHPTWQTRIGQWFIKYFPNIQFIVTTHSPLVCRACERGSIWRLAAPGTENKSGQITGIDKDRLIYGNVLDAYGTEIFGEAISISKEGNDKRTRLGELNIKSLLGEKVDENELTALKKIFPTKKMKLK